MSKVARRGSRATMIKKYSGSVMLMDALARSLNIPTVNIGMKVGLSKVIDTQKAMGWDNVEIPKVPAMLLGAYTISPYDVTKLYQTIANQGGRIELTTVDTIADRQGNIIYQHDKNRKTSGTTRSCIPNVICDATNC